MKIIIKCRRTIFKLIIMAILANLLAIPSLLKHRFVGFLYIGKVIIIFTIIFTLCDFLITNVLCPIKKKDHTYMSNMKTYMIFRAIYFFVYLIVVALISPSKIITIISFAVCVIGIGTCLSGLRDVLKYIDEKFRNGISDDTCVTTYISCRSFWLDISLHEIVCVGDSWNKIGTEIAMTPYQTYDFPHGPALNYWVYSWYQKKYKSGHSSDKLVIYYKPTDFGIMSKNQMNALLEIVDEHINRGAPVMCIYDYPILLLNFITPGADKDYLSLELKKRNIKFVFDQSDDWEVVNAFLREPKKTILINGLRKDDLLEEISEENQIDYYIANLKKYTKADDLDNRFSYVNSQILKMYGDTDNVELFYVLINMTEYVFHYRALCIAYANEDPLFTARKSFTSSMGLWCKIQNGHGEKYSSPSIIKAYNTLGIAVSQKVRNKKVIEYSEICERITQLRNRYIGHGTMAFSVSDELLNALIILVTQIMKVFYNDSNVLKSDMLIDDNVPLIIEGYNHIFLLSAFDFSPEKGDEYIDYFDGSVVSENKEVVYDLDYQPNFESERV